MDLRLLLVLLCVLVVFVQEGDAWRRRRRRRYVPPCYPTNCQVGGWSAWGPCTTQCGSTGTRVRNRHVIRGQSCGGSCPYHLSETQACNRNACQNGGWNAPTSCNCKPGFTGTCCQHDIDECAAQPPKCHQICTNTQGSYSCSCKNGYKMGADGRTCEVDVKCSVDFIGCYKDYYTNVLNITLLTARDKNGDNFYGETINWKEYDVWLPKFICACANKTENAGFNVFSIQYYGLCMTGSGNYTIPGQSTKCKDSEYQTCQSDSKWCTGSGRTNAMYRIVP